MSGWWPEYQLFSPCLSRLLLDLFLARRARQCQFKLSLTGGRRNLGPGLSRLNDKFLPLFDRNTGHGFGDGLLFEHRFLVWLLFGTDESLQSQLLNLSKLIEDLLNAFDADRLRGKPPTKGSGWQCHRLLLLVICKLKPVTLGVGVESFH